MPPPIRGGGITNQTRTFWAAWWKARRVVECLSQYRGLHHLVYNQIVWFNVEPRNNHAPLHPVVISVRGSVIVLRWESPTVALLKPIVSMSTADLVGKSCCQIGIKISTVILKTFNLSAWKLGWGVVALGCCLLCFRHCVMYFVGCCCTTPVSLLSGTFKWVIDWLIIIIISCAHGDTVCLSPLQVDNIFLFIRQVAPVPACWLFKTSATSWPLTFWPWKCCHVWRVLPLCQF